VSEGSVFQRKDGRWCAKYEDAKGKTRYLYRKTKAEAKQALRQALRDRDEGIVPVGKMAIGAVLDHWLKSIEDTVSRRTWVNRESLVRIHIKPAIGTKKLATLRREDIQSLYQNKLSQGLSNSTVKRIHTILNQVFKQISPNVIADVKPPKEDRREVDVLSPKQVKELLSVAHGDRLEAVYVLGATCGLRVGESLALRWEDVDLDKGILKVRRTLWNGRVFPPKTTTSHRTLKLPKIALEALKKHAKKNNDGWLFPTKNGTPVGAANFWQWGWKPMLRKARLPESTHYHDLRHGVASFLLSQNVPVPVVSKYLGHADPSITLRIYAHVINGMEDLAADGMNEALG
jgi:integrase